MPLNEQQKNRYARHLVLEGVGEEGQEKLLKAKVLVIGTGGLGSPILMYLTAAGVGYIGIVDCDSVDESNLQRQIIHANENIGRSKVESAKESILRMNPYTDVKTYETRINKDNIEDIIKDYDIIVEATDNFDAIFTINDACVKLKKPFVHAGVVEIHGQLMTYVPDKGPCYRCVFNSPPPQNEVKTCKDIGVLGAMVGIIGSMQALEVIKYITGVGELLTGRMMIVDGLTMKARTINLHKDPNCKACH